MIRPPATIAVCTFRHGPDAVDALRSAIAEAGADDEVLLVRSGAQPHDPMPEPLGPWLGGRGASVTVVSVGEPGAALARSAALSSARHEIVAFLDDDVVADPGWLASLLAPLVGDEGVGAAGGSIRAVFPHGQPSWLPRSLHTYYGIRLPGAGRMHLPFGANMAIRRAAAVEAGGFDPDLGHRGSRPGLHEETELCRRISAAGWKVADAPAAIVRHRVRSDQVGIRWVLRRAWQEGRSDLARARARHEDDVILRSAKLVALLAATPVAALGPRARVHVAARVLVNAGYLRERFRSRDGRAGAER